MVQQVGLCGICTLVWCGLCIWVKRCVLGLPRKNLISHQLYPSISKLLTGIFWPCCRQLLPKSMRSLVCFLFALFCNFALAMMVYWPLMWPITHVMETFLSGAPMYPLCPQADWSLSPWPGLILTPGPQVTPASTGSGSFLECSLPLPRIESSFSSEISLYRLSLWMIS